MNTSTPGLRLWTKLARGDAGGVLHARGGRRAWGGFDDLDHGDVPGLDENHLAAGRSVIDNEVEVATSRLARRCGSAEAMAVCSTLVILSEL